MPEPMNKVDVAQAANAASAKDAQKKAARAKFEGAWAVIRDELLEHMRVENMPKDAQEWYHRSLDFNTPGGKLNRGMSVVDSAEILKGRALTDAEYFQAAVLGWCIELLQAFFLVSDDMMDGSITRRGQPCWYRIEGVGNIAINDSFMLEGAIYFLLKKHFRTEPYYVYILELFHDTTFQTEMGQLVDLITAPEDHVDLSKFSLEKHAFIVEYKTAYYSFYLPVALAMHLCGIPEPAPGTPAAQDPYKQALAILLPLGEYFQVQDDFLDFAGTPAQIGKIGTDIVDNKCSWCVNTALARATPAQRAVLDANYGRKDAACEARVKALYEEMDLRGVYARYEEESYKRVMEAIGKVDESTGLKKGVFISFLEKIYKRTK